MRLERLIVFIVILFLTVSHVACGGSSGSQSDLAGGEEPGSGDVAIDDTGDTVGDTGDGDTDGCSGPWYQANLTWYESYPDPDSEECIEYNGCTWAGQFYGLDETQTEQWVAAHNIASVHQKDWNWLGLKNIKIRQGDHEIIATVYDLCSDSDCDGCCTQNLGPVNPDGNRYLIDLESYTAQRFGSDSGTVEFQICSGTGGGDTASDDTGGDSGTSVRWAPQVGDTWQWQLQGSVNTTYDVTAYDIDLFDNSAAAIQQLHDQGRRAVCYFSAGSYENWRPDAGDFTSADLGNALDGWPGERWLDIRSTHVRNIMTARLDLAAQKGCDAVEPDNVDGYTNGTGFPLSAADQLDYNRFLARQAHERNLAVALKNDVDQAADLVGDFDFTVNEACHAYDECDTLSVFIQAGKPVFNAEYDSRYVNDTSTRQSLCEDALAEGFSTLVLPLDLDDSFRYSCGAPDSGSADTGDEGSDDTAAGCSGPWYQANLTWYESYPDPDSEECIEYNGCTWAGQFYGLEGAGWACKT